MPEIEERFLKIDRVVSEMLRLFDQYEIHATWATVGLLAHENLTQITDRSKGKEISYVHQNLSPFPIDETRYGKIPIHLLTAKKQIHQILQTPHQELASHTFAHYYTLENGQTEAEFREDVLTMQAISQELGVPFKSIVFPRNQVNPVYLNLLKDSGYVCFRGNQPNRFWRNVAYESETFFQKAGRTLDAYFKISKTKRIGWNDLKWEQGVLNIPASRFLKPYSGNTFLERRKLRRIKNELREAAEHNLIYHLWWHPHNLTRDPENALRQLEEILKYHAELKKTHGMTSLNMSEITAYVAR